MKGNGVRKKITETNGFIINILTLQFIINQLGTERERGRETDVDREYSHERHIGTIASPKSAHCDTRAKKHKLKLKKIVLMYIDEK